MDRLDELALNTDTEVSPSAKSTFLPPSDRKLGDIKHVAEFWISADGVNVGTLRKQRLWNRLHMCFSTLCQISTGQLRCAEPRFPLKTPTCKFPNIVSDKTGNGDYDTSSMLSVSYRLIKHNPGKRNLDDMTVRQFTGTRKP